MGVPRVVDEVRRFLATHGAGDRPGVVAVSGGADSVALARALVEAGCGSLTVAHVNHGLRGAESDADEAFVLALAHGLSLPCVVGRCDPEALHAAGNLEAAARRARYDFLATTAADPAVNAGWVATGHTADDQAETVLHRLLRGTGLQGLRGIAGVRALGDPDEPRGLPPRSFGTAGVNPAARLILRPLLAVTRAEVVAYLASLGQPFRTDSTNADPRFTRNRIRSELLPLLKTFNPDVVAALGRLAGQADEAHAVIAGLARTLLERAERPRAGTVIVLDASELQAAAPLVAREAFRLMWEREGWPTGDMRHDHWRRLLGVAAGACGGWDFPGGVSARRRGRVVRVGRRL